jgi:curved DNA-binding protein CbpA
MRPGFATPGPWEHSPDVLTHYDVLGVDPAAEMEAIRRAWRLKVRLLHPDRHRDSPDDVQAEAARETLRVNKAWDILRDPDKRRQYDLQLLRIRDREVEREQPGPASESREERPSGHARPVWLSPNNYLNLASFLIVLVATGFVVAGAVLLARLTQ